jgi:hypothetical protein
MDFNPEGNWYPEDLINSSFSREVRYLERLQKYSWSPEIVTMDKITRRIVFRWYGNTCEDIIPDDYVSQLESIVIDLDREGIYKPSFYPKYFYVDSRNKIHAFNFYSASDYSEQPISIDFYKPILNSDRLDLIEKISTDGKLDMRILMKYAFNDYIKWPGNILPKIYEKVYGL